MASSTPVTPITVPRPSSSPASSHSSSTIATVVRSPATRPSASPSSSFPGLLSAIPPFTPRLRRESRSVTSSSVRAASRQESVKEDVEVGSPTGVATSGGLSSPSLGEGGGEGVEIGSVGVTTAEQVSSPPPYPQGEAGIAAAAGAADVEEDEENADDPPDFFQAEVDAETFFNRGVRLLHLTQENINELDQLSGLAGGRPAAGEARRRLTLAGAELQQAFITLHHEFDREDAQRTALVNQLTENNVRLQRDLHTAQIQHRLQRDRGDAMNQLRNQLEALLHQARVQIRHQEREMREAAPGIQQLAYDRDFAARDAEHFEREAEHLRLRNALFERELVLATASEARQRRHAEEMHTELHRWHRMTVRLNDERSPEHRYNLPYIAHYDTADDPALEYVAGHEFDEPLPPLPPSPVEGPEGGNDRDDETVAQPEEANQLGGEFDQQEQTVAAALEFGNRHLQEQVEEHFDDFDSDVDSNADTVVGFDSE
ncbi:hypothetical protein EPUS_08020 [Endocarpon pusillum Z07020]|uniref:Uncharacterized protein n=1 Tax=Endocarpon pusillum (strain Z07020 / HMAS-L-300199) TaxID=1263415 RepID=U1HLE2_ENDPU|nr:uncharacterized protein EPUS_08020 [Endocarpon pusillum Z07020]ERF69819.1 hypothetical protein EPUS_08020 [Endocarpon pusillum Z07020]